MAVSNERDPLTYDYWPSELDASAHAPVRVLILMHGRGANRHDLGALKGRLPRAWHVIVPDAPHSAAAWGYGPGSAWYRFLGDDRPEAESIATSIAALERLVTALPSVVGGNVASLVLGGFSQGGTMSHAYALTHPGRVHGVLNFSGFLPSTVAVTADTVGDTRFFWGHGVQDANIPFALAEKGRAALRAAGAQLESRDYAIGHWIDPDELRDASNWLSAFE